MLNRREFESKEESSDQKTLQIKGFRLDTELCFCWLLGLKTFFEEGAGSPDRQIVGEYAKISWNDSGFEYILLGLRATQYLRHCFSVVFKNSTVTSGAAMNQATSIDVDSHRLNYFSYEGPFF